MKRNDQSKRYFIFIQKQQHKIQVSILTPHKSLRFEASNEIRRAVSQYIVLKIHESFRHCVLRNDFYSWLWELL